MQALNRELSEKYGLDLKTIAPFRDSFIISTSKDKKILKKIPLPPERIRFINNAKEYLFANGFKNLDRFLCTNEGEPFIAFEGEYYVLTDIIDGRECNFSLREDVATASKLLGQMHKASKGFVPEAESNVRDELGKLPIYFSKRLDELKKLKKVARKGKSGFDYLYLDHADYFCTLGEESLREMESSRYYKLVDNARKEGVICHHDYTHHNIIISDSKASVINFNYCCIELKTYDLANLIRRKMRKSGWSIPDAKNIIDHYRAAENLSEDDFFAMKHMLNFPQKFWRVANRFYNSKRSWSEKSYLFKLQEVIGEIEGHKSFMDRFDELME